MRLYPCFHKARERMPTVQVWFLILEQQFTPIFSANSVDALVPYPPAVLKLDASGCSPVWLDRALILAQEVQHATSIY